MSNLTNLVAEQFQELNDTYELQKKQTKETFLYKQAESKNEHKEAIAQINIELKSNEAQLLSLIRKIEEKRGSIVTVEELASVLTLIADPVKTVKTDSITKDDALDDTLDNSIDNSSNDSSKKSDENQTIEKEELTSNASKPKPRYKGKYYR